jgi:hypothetical protein
MPLPDYFWDVEPVRDYSGLNFEKEVRKFEAKMRAEQARKNPTWLKLGDGEEWRVSPLLGPNGKPVVYHHNMHIGQGKPRVPTKHILVTTWDGNNSRPSKAKVGMLRLSVSIQHKMGRYLDGLRRRDVFLQRTGMGISTRYQMGQADDRWLPLTAPNSGHWQCVVSEINRHLKWLGDKPWK